MQLKILSWNIWIDCNFDQVTEFLKSSNADIVGLQEIVENDPKRDIIKALSKLGYQHAFAPVKKVWGNKTWSDGPAIFSKYNILENKKYTLSKTDSRVAVRAIIQAENKILYIFNTHLIHTHQQQSDVQDEQVDNLIKLLPQKQAIVMGDFNATPDSSVINKMRKILTDSDPNSAPTWSVYPEGCVICNPSDINIRLDYIFITPDIKILSSKVELSRASDHLPISAIIKV